MTVFTDAAGAFQIVSPGARPARVRVVHSRYLETIVELKGAPSRELRISLTPAALLVGTIESEEDGGLVRLVGKERTWQCYVLADGSFRFPRLPPGSYRLEHRSGRSSVVKTRRHLSLAPGEERRVSLLVARTDP